jgi:hypothetical protein
MLAAFPAVFLADWQKGSPKDTRKAYTLVDTAERGGDFRQSPLAQ